MSLMTKLARAIGADVEEGPAEILPRLRRLYVALVQESRQLSRHQELAPHEAGQEALRQLADAERAHAEHLRKAILDLDGFPGDVREKPEPLGSLNYWARLVRDLEAHRETVIGLLEEATHLTDDHAELADSLRELARAEETHAERLRALIARSDPQALD